jgi:hypothetical protein
MTGEAFMRALGLVATAALVGCAQEYGLQSVDPQVAVGPQEIVAQGQRGPVEVATPSTPAATPSERPQKHRPRVPRRPREGLVAQEVPLGGGARTDVVDFLFVVDGSASMKSVVAGVFDGFDALVDEDAFPKDARIAVTSTLPADPTRRSHPHPAVHHRGLVRFDPGFQRLVDAEGIAAVRTTFPEATELFALDGCDAWFAPGDENARGIPCFQAHTQLSLLGVGVEAGLTAVNQLLERGPVFRTGAAANIVFVSDTQDPGIKADHPGFDELVSLRPTGDEVVATASARQVTSSLRLHAIAPVTRCGNEPYEHIGDVYGDAARATGGHAMDLCEATPDDYVAMVRGIVDDGSVPTTPVVPLAHQDRVRAVFVDGVEVPYHLSRDHRAVVLDTPMPSERSNVRIEYKAVPTPAAGVAPAAARASSAAKR